MIQIWSEGAAFMSATQIDEATLTKMKLRKLNAVCRSIGNEMPISAAEASPEWVSK